MNFILKYKTCFTHLITWVGFVTIIGVQLYVEKEEIPYPFFIRTLIGIVVYYVNYLFLIERFLLRKETFLYMITILAMIVLATMWYEHIDFESFSQYASKQGFKSYNKALGFMFNSMMVFLGGVGRMYKEWNKNEIIKRDIETKKQVSELEALKNQINPHFLFNSLNSIYSLAVKKSDLAPETIVMLSELMRYMLYETNDPKVSLDKELAYIDNYINLQRIRVAHQEKIKLSIKGKNTGQKIPPLILIPFIENAFKYGSDASGNKLVDIRIDIVDGVLYFECENEIGKAKRNAKNSGIGLENTKERLRMLFKNKHRLHISQENGKYRVELKLVLD